MAVITLSTTPTEIGRIHTVEGTSDDRYFSVKAYYTNTDKVSTKNICVDIMLSANDAISGLGKATVNGKSASFSFSSMSNVTVRSFQVKYDLNTGTCSGKSLTVALSEMEATWGEAESFNANPTDSPLSISYKLPNIDPLPTCGINSVSVLSDDYNGKIIAGFTTLRASMKSTHASSATFTQSGSGRSQTDTLTAAATMTHDFIPLAKPYQNDMMFYTADLKLKVANGTGSATASIGSVVYTYTKPLLTDSFLKRCFNDPQDDYPEDLQGDHCYLHLEWNATPIDSNAVSDVKAYATINGSETQLTPLNGSVNDGYLNYLFAVQTNQQADIRVVLTDDISSSTDTSMVLPKGIMPLSLYQQGTDVGVSVGQMATGSGFNVYLPFSLKEENTAAMHSISVDANRQILVDGMAPGTSGYQILSFTNVSVTNSSMVANRDTAVLSGTMSVVSGATDYILIPTRVNYGFYTTVASSSISGNTMTVSATAMNGSGSSHTLSGTILVIALKS